MEIYTNRKIKFESALELLKKKYNTIGLFRIITIILFLFFVYNSIKTQNNIFLIPSLIFLILFLILMRRHSQISNQKSIKEALIKINIDEIDYLSNKKIPFENGEEFIDFSHPYAFDLDIFGNHSLFQNLNRTNTFVGKKTLANQLLELLPNEAILKNHSAIKELSDKLDWRQEFMAFAKISNDCKSIFDSLLRWSRFKSTSLSKTIRVISFITPCLFFISIVAYLISNNSFFLTITLFLFVFHLFILGLFYKRISIEIENAENIDKIIKHYGLLLQKVENEVFVSEKLIALQQNLGFKNKMASAHLKQLSALFSKMDTIKNFVVNLLFNGIFLFHLHILNDLIQWKNENQAALEIWLNTIGEIEMLNSLSNFSFNNPEFIFPNLNTNFEISFTNLSHPLLKKDTRIDNDVHFQPQSFMILTGSNMSGKSTFLRSLGINMVLTGIGSSVCAKNANVHPLPVLVSMRLSDSLSDSESYFYAEIKRLKLIMDQLQEHRAFVLLDEILRGTNSDDKRNGTVEVIKKMINKNALGAIATHDI